MSWSEATWLEIFVVQVVTAPIVAGAAAFVVVVVKRIGRRLRKEIRKRGIL